MARFLNSPRCPGSRAYNRVVRKLNALSVASAVALAAITAYLIYGAVTNYRSFQEISSLSEEFYKEDVKPEQLDSKIAAVREHLETSPSPPLKLLLFDMLLFKAYYFPDDSVAPLSEALELGQEQYRTLKEARGPIGAQLAFGYLYAGLPTKLETWRVEVAARDPQYRPQLSLLAFYGHVLSDDLAGAQALVDAEAKDYGQSLQTRAMVTAAYHTLGLEHDSRQFALEPEQLSGIGSSLGQAYALFLLETGDYVRAEELLRRSLDELQGDPGRALELALCLAVTRGIDDAEVRRLLDIAAESTRDPMSRDGAEALCLAGCYALDGNTAHAENLLDMADRAGDDFHVLAAIAELSLEFARKGVDLDLAFPGRASGPAAIDDPAGLARRLIDSAATPVRLQRAHLQLALALTESAKGMVEPRHVLAEAVDHFAIAIGSGDGSAMPATDRMPDYDIFLLDPTVMELRRDAADFDREIHRAVIDLLNRRREMFKNVVSLPSVEYTR